MMSNQTLTTPVSRVSLADQVYDRLLEEIQIGRLRSGDHLSEVSLAERYAVSRTPVREALRRLSSERLVRSTGNRFATVVRLSRQETIDAFHVRQCLEVCAARQAAERITQVQIDTLRQMADRAVPSNGADWVQAEKNLDLRLHSTIAEVCGNELLRREIQRYLNMVRLVRGISAQNTQRLAAGHAEHQQIIEALDRHDSAAAGDLMSRHIAAALAAVLAEVNWEDGP